MSKDEALKMAIEALETSDAIVAEYSGVHFERIQPAIQACKEALQQPMQDFFERGKEIAKWADKQNEQPAQEPYKFIHPYYGNLTEMLPTKKEQIAPSCQGLSDGDVMKIVWDLEHITDKDLFVVEFYRAIEAKLKEKNHD